MTTPPNHYRRGDIRRNDTIDTRYKGGIVSTAKVLAITEDQRVRITYRNARGFMVEATVRFEDVLTVRRLRVDGVVPARGEARS